MKFVRTIYNRIFLFVKKKQLFFHFSERSFPFVQRSFFSERLPFHKKMLFVKNLIRSKIQLLKMGIVLRTVLNNFKLLKPIRGYLRISDVNPISK